MSGPTRRSPAARALAALGLLLAAGIVAGTSTPGWAAPPANDNFANAEAHNDSFTDSLNTDEATTEAGESGTPSCVPVGSSKTVWYSLTLTTGGTVTIDTRGSDFDTVLAVYTGATLGTLSEVACNDDIGGSPHDPDSEMAFTAAASTTYWIQVGGFTGQGNESGNLLLNAVAPAQGPACTITGTAGNDTLYGTNGDDVICGLGGNDTIYGKNGDDTILGGDGDDILSGGNGNDIIDGGAGNDSSFGETLLGSLLYLFDNGADTITGGPGDDNLNGQNGNDVLSDTSGIDTMSGGLGNDIINVQDGSGGDTANGGLGSDTCTVDAGDSTSSC